MMGFATQSTIVVILVACVIATAAVDATAMDEDPILKKINGWIGKKAWCRKDNGTRCYTALENVTDPEHGWCMSKFEDLLETPVQDGATVHSSCNALELISTVEFCTNTSRVFEQHCTNAKQSTVPTTDKSAIPTEKPTTTTTNAMTTVTTEGLPTSTAPADDVTASSSEANLSTPTPENSSTFGTQPESMTTNAPGNGEENSSGGTSDLYWILPVAGLLLIVLIALPVVGFYVHKRAGYNHSTKRNGEALGKSGIESA